VGVVKVLVCDGGCWLVLGWASLVLGGLRISFLGGHMRA
jgi:hypothetical protein